MVNLCSYLCQCGCFLWFFTQETAYEMRMSDWSSDVCSSDLDKPGQLRLKVYRLREIIPLSDAVPVLEHFGFRVIEEYPFDLRDGRLGWIPDRKRVVWGKSVSVRVDLGGRRIIKQKIRQDTHRTRL